MAWTSETMAANAVMSPKGWVAAGAWRRGLFGGRAYAEAHKAEVDRYVVVAEPAVIGSGPSGLADLYVALTRATSRLDLVRTGPLPAPLADAF